MIEIFDDNAEQALILRIQQLQEENIHEGALLFHSSQLPGIIHKKDIIDLAETVTEQYMARIYFCKDSDIIITWRGVQQEVLEKLSACLKSRFPKVTEDLLHYYDMQAHAKDLKLVCRRKIGDLPNLKVAKKIIELEHIDKTQKEAGKNNFEFTPEQKESFKLAASLRKNRKQLEVLIIEDQAFSRTLLYGMLTKICKAFDAVNGGTALRKYLLHAPDITFLDIELPDINGHDVLKKINEIDPDAFVVMVTANNYVNDVMLAKGNQAKGFITKPYSKQKILEYFEKYKKESMK